MTDSSATSGRSEPVAAVTPHSVREVAAFFLRLGTVAFGGPAAHIAIMEDDLVRRRKWLSRERFLDLLGASSIIPGPSSTEFAIHLGYLRAGWRGLIAAGACFIGPAAIMVTALAWAYVRFGKIPATAAVLYGVKPVVIAVILQALWFMSRTAVKTRLLAAVAVLSIALGFYGVHPLLLLVIAGALMVLARLLLPDERKERSASAPAVVAAKPLVATSAGTASAAAAGAAAIAAPFSLGSMFLVFLKIGAVVFGSGYVLLAFLHADLVAHRHWLTDAQLVDAVAIGQVTPGPVFTAATFIGYLLGGVRGAGLATAAVFLPAFVLVAASGPLVPRIRRSRIAAEFLDGVIVGSLALMAVVTWQLGRASLVDWLTVALAIVSLVLLLRLRLNSAWLILLGAVVGVSTSMLHLH
jgi:chromate transporter